MKAPHSFSRNRFFSSVRFASAVTLMSAAAAMAFVAAKSSGPFLLGKSGNTDQAINKFRQDRDQSGGNRRAMPGPETDRGPIAAAEEAYSHRAYPASDVPFRLTVNAQQAWASVKSMSQPSANAWTLVGPSAGNFPDILTFSGRSLHDLRSHYCAGHYADLHKQRLHALGCSRGRRCLAHEQGARKPAKLDIRLGQLRDQRDRDVDLRRCDGTRSTRELASRTHRVIRRPVLAFTNQPIAVTHGRISLRTRASQRCRPRAGPRLRIPVRLSTGAPSRRSWLAEAPCTSVPRAPCAE